jgi:hypothetical protein
MAVDPIDPDILLQTAETGTATTTRAILDVFIAKINEIIAGGGGTGAAIYDVKNYGAVGDGVTDDTVAIQTAINEAYAAGAEVYFSAGTYKITRKGNTTGVDWSLSIASGSGFRARGENATIRYQSTYPFAAMYFVSGQSQVHIEGLRFEGDNNDDSAVNTGQALYFGTNSTKVRCLDCEFYRCLPTIFADSASSKTFLFDGCRVYEAPNAASGPSDSTFINSSFINLAHVSTRSHAIYLFGQSVGCRILGCNFEYIADQDIQIRAGAAANDQKRNFVIAGNTFLESRSYSIWAGSDTDVNVGGFNISDNNFKGCYACIQVQGTRDAVIANNFMEWDYSYTGSRSAYTAAIGVYNALSVSSSYASGVKVTGNRMIQRHPFYGVITIDSVPSAGDTITIGSTVYTWRASAPGVGDIQIGSNVGGCVENAWEEIRGVGVAGNAINAVLRDMTDAFYDTANSGTNGKLYIASAQTFALSKTGTHVTITAVIDNRDSMAIGIVAEGTRDCEINGNVFENMGTGINIVRNLRPTVFDNTFIGQGAGASLINAVPIVSQSNVLSRYERNRIIRNDIPGPLPAQMALIDDGFPVLRDNDINVEQDYATPQLGGGEGWVSVGDGFAHCYLWYGTEIATSGSRNKQWRWNDGDTVVLSGIGATQTCTFKRTGPGANEFNTQATLTAWIQALADYNAAIVVGGGGNNTGYIKITAAASGTGGNSGRVTVTTKSRINGVVLKAYGETSGRLLGGAAAATTTVVWSPVASSTRPSIVRGRNATAEALIPIVDPANNIGGVAALITHSAAAGTESFWFRL